MADGSIPADAGKVMRAAQGGIDAYDEQQMQRELYDARGFHGKGKVMSREEFNDATEEAGFTEVWRGVEMRSDKWGPVSMMQDRAGYTRAERTMARDIIEGDEHYPGRGMYGNGTYMAMHENTSMARMAAEGYGPNLIRIGLPKSVTENTFESVDQVGKYVQDIVYDKRKKPKSESEADEWEIEEGFDPKMHSAAFKTAQNLYKAAKAEGMNDDDIIVVTGDTGRVATILGIDGYVVKGKRGGASGPEYVVGVNRSVMTFDSTVYDSTGIVPRHKP